MLQGWFKETLVPTGSGECRESIEIATRHSGGVNNGFKDNQLEIHYKQG